MTFPTTGILDDFTRANENPLSDSGSWTCPLWAGDSNMAVISDQCAAENPSNDSDAYWNLGFNAYCEAYATVIDPTAGIPYIYACITSEGTSDVSGYMLWLQSGSFFVDRFDDGASTEILSGSLTQAAGDSYGISVDTDGTIGVWQQPSDGEWSSVGSTSDDTYTSGKIGFGWSGAGSDPLAVYTSFGGGGSSPSPPLPPSPSPTGPNNTGLFLTVCDLNGNAITDGSDRPLPVRTPDQPQVTIPLSDSRTGQVAVSMYEPVAGVLHDSAGEAVVRMLYRNPKGDEVLVLNGIVMNPDSNFDAGTVTAQLHDSTMRLKKRFLGYNHASIILGQGEPLDSEGTSYSEDILDTAGLGEFYNISSVYGIPLDGFGLRLLLLDTSHGAADWHGWPYPSDDEFVAIPPMGIRYQPGYSVDDANPQPAYGPNGVPPTGVGGLIGGAAEGTGFSASATEGSAVLENVNLDGATDAGGNAATWAELVEYMALTGPGIPEFAQILSTDEGASTITMSLDATENTGATSDGLNAYVAQAAIYCQLSRGDCVYDDLSDMVQAQGAFECDWIPVDAAHLGPSGATWVAGQLCELYTANRVGTDRSQGNPAGNVPVVFVNGIGGFHLDFSPDADSLITYEVQVGPGGPDGDEDVLNKVEFIADSVNTYGIWEDWQQATAAGTGDTPISNYVLANRAAAILTAYQQVPKFMTATIDTDAIGAYAFGTDYFLGDTVTVVGQKGYVSVGPVAVRITQIEVTQTDPNGNCQIQLSLVPYLTANPGISPDDE